MKRMKRAIHLDFHTMPGIDNFAETYNGAEIAEILKNANVDYVNMFARCNIGFSYYPTKIGIPYPTMKGNLLGDVIRECHKRDIGVTAYLNAGLNHELMLKNPGYLKIRNGGYIYMDTSVKNNFFRLPCFNTGYRDYLLSEIKEIVEQEPDGIFCDCLVARTCYCPACVRKAKARGLNAKDESDMMVLAVETLKEVFADIRAVVPENMRLYLNTSLHEDLYQYVSHSEIECLPTGEWGYDYFDAQAPYHAHFSQEKLYMTGCFVESWGDFSGKKTKAAIENDVYDALLYGYAPSIGDHMHPAYGLNKKLYSDIGDIYSFVQSLEKWTDNTKPMYELAILRNKVTPANYLTPLSDSDSGVARMFAELKICYDVVNEDMDFAEYKVLVLPDEIKITDKLLKKLEAFKGAIISSGTSIRESKIWKFITDITPDTNTDCFYTFDGQTYGGYLPAIKFKSDYSISDYVEPYFRKEFDGLHGYFYNPPRRTNGYSAIAKCGNVIHIGFKIFEAYLKNSPSFLKSTINSLINEVYPDRIIQGDDLPSYTRASIFKGKNDILHIKTTIPELRGSKGIVEDHIILPEGYKIKVKGNYISACTLPNEAPLITKRDGEYIEITLPRVTGYKAILLK